jgi:hypothetical protein
LSVLGTQETFCIIIAGLLERDSFDLLLPEFDKPWVIHLRETCCCSTNLCTWRPNTVYKNRRMCRHQRDGVVLLLYVSICCLLVLVPAMQPNAYFLFGLQVLACVATSAASGVFGMIFPRSSTHKKDQSRFHDRLLLSACSRLST